MGFLLCFSANILLATADPSPAGGCGFDVLALALQRLEITYDPVALSRTCSPSGIVSFADLRREFESRDCRVNCYEFEGMASGRKLVNHFWRYPNDVLIIRLPTGDAIGHFVVADVVQENGLTFIFSLKNQRVSLTWRELFENGRLAFMVVSRSGFRLSASLEWMFFSVTPLLALFYFIIRWARSHPSFRARPETIS
jgi:hypothetical protein